MLVVVLFLCVKQKTAYEMLSSDWSQTCALPIFQGFQSRNVNNGNYGLAACSSFAMGFSQVYVLSKVISSASILHTLAYCTGGALGIVLAMYVHRRFVQKGPK